MGISRHIYVPEYASENPADWAEFDEDVVARAVKSCEPVFASNEEFVALSLSNSAVTKFYTGFDDEAEPLDITQEGWRFECIVVYNTGGVWERYYNKYTNEVMEVCLE